MPERAERAAAEGDNETAETYASKATEFIDDANQAGFFSEGNAVERIRQDPRLAFIVDRLDLSTLQTPRK